MLKSDVFRRLGAIGVLAVSFAAPSLCWAVAMQRQPAPEDDTPIQTSGIVPPGVATGFVQIEKYSHFNDGTIAIAWCAKDGWGGCAVQQWLTPADAVKKFRGANLRYTGFQLFMLKDGPQLYLYYK